MFFDSEIFLSNFLMGSCLTAWTLALVSDKFLCLSGRSSNFPSVPDDIRLYIETAQQLALSKTLQSFVKKK